MALLLRLALHFVQASSVALNFLEHQIPNTVAEF